MDERSAQIALACLVEPGEPRIADQVAEHGANAVLARVLARSASARPAAGRVDPQDVPAMLAAMSAAGVRVLVPGDPEFPSQVLDLGEPPLALWVRGPLDLRAAALRSASIVGARACTAYGERATAALASGIAERGWSVISGAAFGIDSAAHRAALGVGGPTVAVLACGIDIAYPRAHEALLCRIGDEGAVVSELPPGSRPLKHRFLARNRIIAALSRGTIVVEAARRSGALATVHRAHEIGRLVMAVPGPITSMVSAGPNALLHDGAARAVSSADEVIGLLTGAALGPGAAGDVVGGRRHAGAGRGAGAGGGAGAERAVAAAQPVLLADLPAAAADVLAVLPARSGRCVEDLAVLAGVPPVVCLAQLGVLEMLGLARRSARGWSRSR
jgi:DNA processing protein